MTIKQTGVFASFICLLAACATAPLTLNDNTIVAGERIGDVEIGMSLNNLLALKGTPLKTIPINGSAATRYRFDGLTVAAEDDVYWIIATDPRFRTPSGIAPGVEQINARGAAGQPLCVINNDAQTTYDYGDFYFTIDNGTALVTEVGVRKDRDVCTQ